MEIRLNGKPETIAPCTLADLVAAKALDPAGLVIELNFTIVRQVEWSEKQLKDGDTVELLSFVGGG